LPLNVRLRLIGIGILLCLALGLTIFCAVQAVQGVQRLQQSRQMAHSGDVRGIRPWMTIPYVSRVYHVPESYLLEGLHISDPSSVRHVTLHSLAECLHRTPDALIFQIQTAIQAYRKQHPAQRQPGRGHSIIPPAGGRKKT
jgi:hypothetical protein